MKNLSDRSEGTSTVVQSHTADRRPFITGDPWEAFERYTPRAQALPANEVERFRASPSEVNRAVRSQVAAVRPHLATVRAKAPWMDLDALQELPTLSLAVLYAAARVRGRGGKTFVVKSERLAVLRERALLFLDLAAEEGLIPVRVAHAIGTEEGPVAVARDAVAIARVFRDHASALEDRHPFKPSTLRALERDGAWVLSELTAGAEGRPTPAADLLDRMGTLLSRGCEDLAVACVAVWGADAAQARVGELLASLRG